MLHYFEKALAPAVVPSLIQVYTWPWAALVNVLSTSSNKHYTLRHPGTAFGPSGNLFSHKPPTLPASRLLEVGTFYTD